MEFLKKIRIFLTPAGAGIAIICFFLPWVKVSCGTITVQASGARIGGIFWLVLIAAILILISFFVFWGRKELFRIKLVIPVAAAMAMIIMLYKFISTFGSGEVDIKSSDLFSVIRPGALGEFVGFIMAMLGSIFILDNTKQNPNQARRRFPYLRRKTDSARKTQTPTN
jgi:hypothetical protein